MSSLTDRFLAQLRDRGLSVSGPKPGDPDDRLYLTGPAAEKTPDVIDAVKKFKAELVRKFGRKPAELPAGE